MSTRTDLYSAFENFDKPNEDDFRELIDFAGVPSTFASVSVTPNVDIITDMNQQTFVVNVRLIYIITYGSQLYMFSALEGTYGAGGTTITSNDIVNITTTTVTAVNDATITLTGGAGIGSVGNFTTNQSSNSNLVINVDQTVLRTTGDFNPSGNFNFTGTVTISNETIATQTWVNSQNYLTSADLPSEVTIPSWVASNQSSVLLDGFGGNLDASRITNLPSSPADEIVFTATEVDYTQEASVTGSYPTYNINIPQGVPGQAGAPGAKGDPGVGTYILGRDTVVNILAKPNPSDGDTWIATDTGTDGDGNPVEVDDALTWSLGSWTNIGPWRGESGATVTKTSDLINDGDNPNDGKTYVLSGTTSFLDLTDTPITYAGNTGRFLKVNSTGNGLEFASSVSTDTYVHTQGAAAQTWNITHTLGKIPSVTILDSTNEQVKASVSIPDDATVVISFGAAYSGTAILN